MMKRLAALLASWAVAAALAVIVTATGMAAGGPAGSGAFDLNWHRIAGGGETFSIGSDGEHEYSLGGTVGQHEPGAMSGGAFSLLGGFLAGADVSVTPQTPCPGDLTESGSVGVPDLLALLSCWGPLDGTLDCDAADLTGSGGVGVPDLLDLLAQWGPCPR